MDNKHEKVSDDVKQRILDAAIQLFADKGYAASSISDISSAADVNRALIYYYFKDKRDLYDYIIEESSNLTFNMVYEIYMSNRTTSEKIKEFMLRFAQIRAKESRSIGRIMMREIVENSTDVKHRMQEGFVKMSSLLSEILEEGIASGEYHDFDTKKMVHILLGITHSLTMMQIHNMNIGSLEDNIEHAMSVILHGIANPEAK